MLGKARFDVEGSDDRPAVSSRTADSRKCSDRALSTITSISLCYLRCARWRLQQCVGGSCSNRKRTPRVRNRRSAWAMGLRLRSSGACKPHNTANMASRVCIDVGRGKITGYGFGEGEMRAAVRADRAPTLAANWGFATKPSLSPSHARLFHPVSATHASWHVHFGTRNEQRTPIR